MSNQRKRTNRLSRGNGRKFENFRGRDYFEQIVLFSWNSQPYYNVSECWNERRSCRRITITWNSSTMNIREQTWRILSKSKNGLGKRATWRPWSSFSCFWRKESTGRPPRPVVGLHRWPLTSWPQQHCEEHKKIDALRTHSSNSNNMVLGDFRGFCREVNLKRGRALLRWEKRGFLSLLIRFRELLEYLSQLKSKRFRGLTSAKRCSSRNAESPLGKGRLDDGHGQVDRQRCPELNLKRRSRSGCPRSCGRRPRTRTKQPGGTTCDSRRDAAAPDKLCQQQRRRRCRDHAASPGRWCTQALLPSDQQQLLSVVHADGLGSFRTSLTSTTCRKTTEVQQVTGAVTSACSSLMIDEDEWLNQHHCPS